ncbi:MAG: class I SAM-dependent methyltransferase [Gemmatimonadota bacterium]
MTDARAFFDDIARDWDDRIATPSFMRRLTDVVDQLGVEPHEHVLDVGCGTGNLTRVLLDRLSPRGRVTAVDFSEPMLEIARGKIDDGRVTWLNADAKELPLPDAAFDHVICFSAWPHFTEHPRVAAGLFRVTRPGGMLHVVHIDGRETINQVHRDAGAAVARHALRDATELSALFASVGFDEVARIDTADEYRVTVRRPA